MKFVCQQQKARLKHKRKRKRGAGSGKREAGSEQRPINQNNDGHHGQKQKQKWPNLNFQLEVDKQIIIWGESWAWYGRRQVQLTLIKCGSSAGHLIKQYTEACGH